MNYVNGQYIARSPEELQDLLGMALGNGGTPRGSAALGLDSPVVAAASAFLPGAMGTDFGVTGQTILPDGPARTPVGYGTSGVRSAASSAGAKATGAMQGIGSRINEVRKGYEAGMKPLVNAQTKALQSMIPQGPVRAPGTGGLGMKAGRMAGAAIKNPLLQKGLAYAPAIGTALAVGDVVLGDESFGNKAMDATAMTNWWNGRFCDSGCWYWLRHCSRQDGQRRYSMVVRR